MSKSLSDLELDPDVTEMKLSLPEKIALQINRNFNARVEKKRIEIFQKEVNAEKFFTDDLSRVTKLFEEEQSIVLPVIFCGYMDEVLTSMYKREIPDGVPGNKADLFRAHGPLSDLSSRIKLAYCFRLISPDLLIDMDRIRAIRNKISHKWDISKFQDYVSIPAIQIWWRSRNLSMKYQISVVGTFRKVSINKCRL
jgi:hypothetical protein